MKHLMLLSLLFATACATSPAVAPHLLGDQADVSQLAGVWHAHIESGDANITGDLELLLARNGELAIKGKHALLWARVNGDEVHATLEPYFDAARGMNIYATFEGNLRDGQMHGVVWERVNFQWVNAGSWSAQRFPQ